MNGDKLQQHSKPLLTIYVAAFNSEDYLDRCLSSCVGQRDGVLEVIVVDDGSTDSTGKIADRWAGEYPTIFKVVHKSNGHYGSVINTALAIATGTWFRMLDSDDWFDSAVLADWLEVLGKTDADIAITPYILHRQVDGRELIRDPFPDLTAGEYDLERGVLGCIPRLHASLTYRVELLRGMGLTVLEGSTYVDEEMRVIPWSKARVVRVDHFPIYVIRRGRTGHLTDPSYCSQFVERRRDVFEHIVRQVDFGEVGKRTAGQSMAFEAACSLATLYVVESLVYKQERKAVEDIKTYLCWIRQLYPDVYSKVVKSRTIMLLQRSGYLLAYPLAAYHRFRAKKKHDKLYGGKLAGVGNGRR